MPKSRVSKVKPWDAVGMSRSAWYRAGKPSAAYTVRKPRKSKGDRQRAKIAKGTAPDNPNVPSADVQRRLNDAVTEALTKERVNTFLAGLESLLTDVRDDEMVSVSVLGSTWKTVAIVLERKGA